MIARMIDPSDAAQVSTALAAYLAQRDDLTSPTFAEPPAPIGRGMDSFIYSFTLTGEALPASWSRPLVLRLQRDSAPGYIEKVRRESAVQSFVAAQGYLALEQLAVEDAANPLGLPFSIMPRIAGGTVFDRMMSRPWQIRRLLRQMAALHARLHRLPIENCPLPQEGTFIERQLDNVRRRVRDNGFSSLEEPLAWIEANAHHVLPEESAFVHNDFHPLNILLDGDAPIVIDWTDAEIGDRHADVARSAALFWFAQIVAGSAAERVLLRLTRGYLRSTYLGEYNRQYPLDPTRLAFWDAFASFGGWLQLTETFATPNAGAPERVQTEFESRLSPDIVDQVAAYFWQKSRVADSLT